MLRALFQMNTRRRQKVYPASRQTRNFEPKTAPADAAGLTRNGLTVASGRSNAHSRWRDRGLGRRTRLPDQQRCRTVCDGDGAVADFAPQAGDTASLGSDGSRASGKWRHGFLLLISAPGFKRLASGRGRPRSGQAPRPNAPSPRRHAGATASGAAAPFHAARWDS